LAAWDGVVRLREPARLIELARGRGGEARSESSELLARIVPLESAGRGDLAPLSASRYGKLAAEALARGASLLTSDALAKDFRRNESVWTHPDPIWALATLLDECEEPVEPAAVGEGTTLGPNVVLHPRVVLGKNVEVGAGSVLGAPGFGWVTSAEGRTRRVPQLGGVIVEDDVSIGPLCTIDAGTLSPTRIRRGAKLDAQVHVGHNVEIGARTFVAAQTGFAGSVRVGSDVLIGGQAGIADHVRIGDRARIAAKSGVIGDVPAGAVVAGYPAVARARWLRALARLYRLG